jgi:hypothetical protein
MGIGGQEKIAEGRQRQRQLDLERRERPRHQRHEPAWRFDRRARQTRCHHGFVAAVAQRHHEPPVAIEKAHDFREILFRPRRPDGGQNGPLQRHLAGHHGSLELARDALARMPGGDQPAQRQAGEKDDGDRSDQPEPERHGGLRESVPP